MTKQQAVKIVKQTALIASSKQDALVACLLLGAGRWETAYVKLCAKKEWKCTPRLRKQVRELIG